MWETRVVIGETIFPHKACHEVTWVSPAIGGRVQNQIDHIYIYIKIRTGENLFLTFVTSDVQMLDLTII
jgi:hypothetical protein